MMMSPGHGAPINLTVTREMIAHASVVLAVVLVAACSGVTPAEQNLYPWNPGQYRFGGVLSYRNDSPSGERTERRQVAGHVSVGRSGPTGMESSDGPCGPPVARVVQQDEVRGTHSFRCGDALFTFRRQRVDIGVNMSVDVTVTTRRRGECVEYQVTSDGRRICARYNYIVDSRWVSRSARISTVIREGR